MAAEELREDDGENVITVDMRWAHERADELVAAGHPWEDVKNCLRLEGQARVALAKLTSDEHLADVAHAHYELAVGKVEADWVEAMIDHEDPHWGAA